MQDRKGRIAELKEEIRVMNLIMSRLTTDSQFRDYQWRLDEKVAELVRLEKEEKSCT